MEIEDVETVKVSITKGEGGKEVRGLGRGSTKQDLYKSHNSPGAGERLLFFFFPRKIRDLLVTINKTTDNG